MDPASLPALDAARLVRTGALSPAAFVEGVLERIERLNPALNAIVWTRTEGALADARRIEAAVRAGEDPGPLAGVPFTVKELTPTREGPTTLASLAWPQESAPDDAEHLRRMRAAGAVLVGKTNSAEFGARPTTESPRYGATRNPWDPSRTAGGSSGGAAAACAAGLSPLAQGSDGGGSIRVPAACCGVVGIKPQRARVTLGPLSSEAWGGLAVNGPIARTVADAAAMLDAMAGPLAGDYYWAPPPDRPFLAAVDDRRPRRAGLWTAREGIAVHPEARAAAEHAAAALADAGWVVEETPGPPVAAIEDAFYTVATTSIGSIPVPRERWALLDPHVRTLFEIAQATPATAYIAALAQMMLGAREVVRFCERYDVLVTPTVTAPPPPLGALGANPEDTWSEFRVFLAFTWPFNATGQPAASVPAGFSSEGLPLGAQIVGRPCDEHAVIAAAARVEEALPWSDRLPPTA